MRNDSCPRTTGFATRAIHAGYDAAENQGALTPPIHLSSTYTFDSAESGRKHFAGEGDGYVYGRLGSPTVSIFEERMASLEGAEAALALGSGMGAITAALWTFLSAGDRIVADQTLYGCTFAFLEKGLRRFGVEVAYADFTDPASLEAALAPSAGGAPTRVVFTEVVTNPNMRVIDVAAVAEAAHRAGARLVVDNTYLTPYLCRPLELGADLVVHSATKYLGGHGDLLAGVVAGGREDVERIRLEGLKDLTGAVLSPFDAFLVLRGLKTLELRMERHSASAGALARRLAAHPAVSKVYYPGLPDDPFHELARRQMHGFGGMVAFEPAGGYEAAVAFLDAVRLAALAVSLGDAETLVQHPASMTHSTYSEEELAEHGISPALVRLSVGLETLADLEADLIRALDEVLYRTARKRDGAVVTAPGSPGHHRAGSGRA